MASLETQIASGEVGDAVAVLVPESIPGGSSNLNGRLLTGSVQRTMKARSMAAKHRQEGLPFEAVLEQLEVWAARVLSTWFGAFDGRSAKLEERRNMTIEITKPEIEALISQRIRSGAFGSPEDVILDALQSTVSRARTGAELVVAIQASPCRELEIEPERYPLPVRDVTL